MIDFTILESYIDIPLCTTIFILLILALCVISSKKAQLLLQNFMPTYDAPQKIHEHQVTRLGGLMMVIALVLLIWLSPNQEIKDTLTPFFFAFLPLGLITLAEDLHKVIAPRVRLAAMLGASFLMLEMTGISLPLIDTPFLRDVLADPFILTIFYVVCIVSLMNGMNFVDGTNGNFSLMTLGMFISLAFLGSRVDDVKFISIIILSVIPLIAFTLLNYPWGKIFAGDIGPYFFAGLIGFLLLLFFGQNKDISAWNALLVTFYPIAELIYSFIRKVYKGKSPMQADRGHLHIKIFTLLNRGSNEPHLSNNMVTMFLGIFWLVPSMILPWVYQSNLLLTIALVFLSLSYITVNLAIPRFD